MSAQSTAQPVLFPALCDRPVHVTFDQPHTSSDGGAVLLAAANRRLRLLPALARHLVDRRDPTRVVHVPDDLLAQRVYGIACGYDDANDVARLARDPVQSLLLDRDPLNGLPLASQPTLSRWENSVGAGALYRMGRALAETVIAHHARRHARARRITIDLDVTDDPTHGTQQLALFNGFYDTWCYLPLLGFLQFDDEAEQYLVAAVLRGGRAPTREGVRSLLTRLLPALRTAFPRARLLVRLDAGFADPALFAFLDAQARTDFAISLPGNPVLARAAAPLLAQAQTRVETSGWSEREYGETAYQAASWPRARRVVIKGEIVCDPADDKPAKANPRYVVTSLRQTPAHVYDKIYCERGQCENRLKELLLDGALGRTSCMRAAANQLRVLLAAAAYVLWQEIRACAGGTSFVHAQVRTLRERLLKLGARVQRSVRRWTVQLPVHAPWRHEWVQIARALGATPP